MIMTDSDSLDFKSDENIDTYNLDYEWSRQAKVYNRWGKEWANAVRAAKRAYAKRKRVKARIVKAVNKNPTLHDWNEDKAPTVSFLDSIIRLDPLFIEADNTYIDADYHARLMEIAKDSMLHRRKALEALVDLHRMNYIAEGGVPKQVTDKLMAMNAQRMCDEMADDPTIKLSGRRPEGG